MKRNTIVLGVLITITIIFASGVFTSAPAGRKIGGVLPPIDPPACNENPNYDVRMDAFTDNGYITNTKATDYTEVSVPVLMYAMDTSPTPDTSLNIVKFDNTFRYIGTELEFIDVGTVANGWSGSFSWSETSGGGDTMKITVSGGDDNIDMPFENWLTMYTINFRILCNDEDMTKLNIWVNDTLCPENNVALAPSSIDEQYDPWVDTVLNQDPDGYVWISEYRVSASIENEEMLLGEHFDTVTVYLDEVNYKYDEIEHYLKFDDAMYNCTNLLTETVSSQFNQSEFSVDGDSIYIHLWNDPPLDAMDEITETTPLYSLEFELKNPSGPGTQDNVESSIYFNENADNCVMPNGCHDLCGTITQNYTPGSLNIPPYEVELYLQFDDDYREPGSSAFLDVFIKNNFVAGLQEAGGDIQLLIAYDNRLNYIGLESTHDSLSLDDNQIGNNDLVSVTLLNDPTLPGYIKPSSDSVFLCRLKFQIDDSFDYDCSDFITATVTDSFQSNIKTVIIDTTGSVTCTMSNGRVTTFDDGFTPWCVRLFTTDVAGGTDVWQHIYMHNDMVIDSVNFEINWDDSKFCLLNDTYWAPGIYTQEVSNPNGLWLKGSNLNLSPGEYTLVADLHFAAKEVGDITGSTWFYEPFADFIHVVDESGNVWYPETQGGSVSTNLGVNQQSLCPLGPPPAKIDGTITPQSFALHQNYPNPFNPSTEIAFDIGNFTWVKVEIYNLLGQKMATLVDSPMDAGSYTVEWYADSDVPSGIYFYSIHTDKFNETKKMMLLK